MAGEAQRKSAGGPSGLVRGTVPDAGPAPRLSIRGRLALVALAVLVFGGPFLSHLHKALRTDHGDWLSIYNVGEFSQQTGRLWGPEDPPLHKTLRYPPLARPLLMLFALPPKWLSAVLSYAFFTALYLWCAAQLSRLFIGSWRWAAGHRAALLLALVLPYVWADLTAGNLTSILLATVTGAFVLAHRGQCWRAGLVLSIGIMLKMIPAICLLYFLVRRRWSVFGGVVVGIVVLGVVPTLTLFGPQQTMEAHREWYRTEYAEFKPLATIDHPIEVSYPNQALVRVLVRLFTDTNAGRHHTPFYITIVELPRPVVKAIYVTLTLVAGGLLLWVQWRYRRGDGTLTTARCYALCVGSMLWFTPWLRSYYFALAMWPAAAVVSQIGDPALRRGVRRWSWWSVALWVLAGAGLASPLLRAYGVTLLAAALVTVTGSLGLGRRDTSAGR